MVQIARNFAWLVSLVSMLALGSGVLRALHHHRGERGSALLSPSDSNEHACDGRHDHAEEFAHTPGDDCAPNPCECGDQDDCATCQLISAFSKANISNAVAIVVASDTQTLVRVACASESVKFHTHFDPHIPRGPPRA